MQVASNFGDSGKIQAHAKMGSRERTRQEEGRRKLETTDKARDFEFIAYIPCEKF